MKKKPENIQTVRRAVKHLLVDRGLDVKGSQVELAHKIGVPYNSLNSALTGFRNTPASLQILKKIQEHLTAGWP